MDLDDQREGVVLRNEVDPAVARVAAENEQLVADAQPNLFLLAFPDPALRQFLASRLIEGELIVLADGGDAREQTGLDLALDDDGAGRASDVIAAIDYAIEHRVEHRIRVLNLSLGHPPQESFRTDPLNRAVMRALASSPLGVRTYR